MTDTEATTSPKGAFEPEVLDAIAASRDELTELAADLIAFDTTTRDPGDPPRQERALQEYLARRLERAGAAVDLWEPDAVAAGASRQTPEGLDFDGRPQLAATFAGTGGGRSLLFNGHIDVVSAEPLELWTSDPWSADVRDGRLYGRGACDMKGGVAAMVMAAEMLARLGVPLAGDLIVNTNTDEESSGAGGLACVEHGVRADAGLCPEDTGSALWRACRGSISVRITVGGRAGHVEVPQPGWREGGAVSAIAKAELVLGAIHDLQARWAQSPELQHTFLAPPSIVPTVIHGGDWYVTYPASCEITVNISYLPVSADVEGYGREVAAEVERAILSAVSADDWLRAYPPTFAWGPDLPPFEVSAQHPIVATVTGAARSAGAHPTLGHTDSWFDAASFVRSGASVVIGYGLPPRGAHGVDEHVAIDDLVECAQIFAISAVRWCGPRPQEHGDAD